MSVMDESGWEATTPPVIETASATTSADNANSGNIAYILAAVGLCCAILFGMSLSSLFQMASELVDESIASPYYDDYDYFDVDQQSDPYDIFQQYLDGPQYNNGLGTTNGSKKDQVNFDEDGDGKVTPKEALGARLALYDATVDSLLPKSAYANAQLDVREGVREIVLADRDASSELATTLRTVAWNDGDLKPALESATGLVDKTITSLQDKKLPAAQGDSAQEISKGLESGKSKVIDRWKGISEELKLIAGSDDVDIKQLEKADELVKSTASEAADAFAEAMGESAKR